MNINVQSVSLRAAEVKDIPFIKSLRDATMRQHYEAAGLAYEIEEQHERILKRFEMAKIIQYGGEDAGFLKVDRTLAPWELVQIQILPRFQGIGLGSYIVGHILEQAKKQGARVGLHVLKGNKAKHFYERLGFGVIDSVGTSFGMLGG